MDGEIFFKRTPRVCLLGAYYFFGVKRKSYAATVIERIYDYYCRDAENLYVEYLLYYRKEFSRFAEFLDKRFNLFPEEIEKKKSILLYHKSFLDESDGSVTYLVEDESIKNALESFLGVNIDDH